MTVVFFWSAAARAVAPASPIPLPAAGQHTPATPSPSQRHTIPSRSARARALSLSLSASGAPARQAAAMGPSVPNFSTPRDHRARSRTEEVERRGPILNCSERRLHVVRERGVLGRSTGAMAPCRAIFFLSTSFPTPVGTPGGKLQRGKMNLLASIARRTIEPPIWIWMVEFRGVECRTHRPTRWERRWPEGVCANVCASLPRPRPRPHLPRRRLQCIRIPRIRHVASCCTPRWAMRHPR